MRSIDKEEIIKFDKSKLPSDAEFKGYRKRIIQNIEIKSNNVLYKLECYYSKSEGKIHTAKLPEYLNGTDYGPEIKAFIYSLYYDCRVTEPKIAEILKSHGISISEGTISNILIKTNSNDLEKEKKEIFEAALEVDEYHQIDDTGMRINGINHYCTVLCNENYSAYFIRRYKNRETVLKILCGIDDDESIDINKVKSLIKILIADDAPQFKKVTRYLGLCWIHEVRHYEKMIAVMQYNRDLVDNVIIEIWDFYKKLKEFKINPQESDKISIRNRYDEIHADNRL